jgi:hypothetical protein
MSGSESDGRTLKLVEQSEYMFSARIEKGPVTPKIVNGWIEKLFSVNVMLISLGDLH